VNRTALIVGAGIGGLSAAIALRQAGWNVRIFERAESARELGFGLSVAPNAIAALRELGVADTVLARGFEPRRGELRRLDGTVLKRAELPRGALRGPMVVALRSALHGALLEALGVDSITFRSRAMGFTTTDSQVTLHLEGGTGVEGDLLLGADGIDSAIRRVLHPDEPPPRRWGIVALRGAVHGAVHHLRGLTGILYLGRGVESTMVRASETGIYWFISMAASLLPPDVREPSAILSLMSARLDPMLRAIASATEDMRVDELVDRDPITSWGYGLVTLLGDAAHPMLPHTGQGAAQAIVDAVTLGRVLRSDVSVEQALMAYQRERRPPTAALVRQGRRTARIMRTTSPIACAIREAVIRALPIQSVVRFYVRINGRAGTA
jgi:2-polyprenyl-6-methoxyphenol hydroxylase-like FAD-dependent oxidoreductase